MPVINFLVSFFGKLVLDMAVISVAIIVIDIILYNISGKAAAYEDCFYHRRLQGLGKEFALQINDFGTDIDKIRLLARRRKRLEYFAGQLKHPARIFAKIIPRSIMIFLRERIRRI